MIYWVMKNTSEASRLAKRFHLKRDVTIDHFQVFKNDEMILTVTRGGAINSAAAVSRLLSLFPPTTYDVLAQLAFYESVDGLKPGGAALCNKLVEPVGQKPLYPDMLFRLPADGFEEVSLGESSPEEAAVFQAAGHFFEAHRIFTFILTAGGAGATADDMLQDIVSWVTQIHGAVHMDAFSFSPEEEALIAQISVNLKLTAAMRTEMNRLVKLRKMTKGHCLDVLTTYMAIQAVDKKERGSHYGTLIKRLVE